MALCCAAPHSCGGDHRWLGSVVLTAALLGAGLTHQAVKAQPPPHQAVPHESAQPQHVPDLHAPQQHVPRAELLPRVPPTTPEQALDSFQTLPGFKVQLLASEPLVADPVCLEYDEHGRAYVCEMCDYPYTDPAADVPFADQTAALPLGRVRLLVDRDRDGRFDTSTIFAEDLSWPTGVACWQGGVYVAATPDVWYLRDNDGDGRADERRLVFSGFRKFNVQAVMNNLKWGLDHRLYAAGGTNGGQVISLRHPDASPVALGAADFAFDPREEQIELLSGGARFGQTFDDWGARFICNIRNPVVQVVLPRHYLARHPLLAVRTALHDAAEAGDTLRVYRTSPPEPWRELRARRWAAETGRVYPRSETAAEGYFTSACGLCIYRGSAFPPQFYGQAFVCEVAGNLVHRQQLQEDGVTYRASRIDVEREFLTSTDNWFRPVNLANAPDGTLHLCDMYRETIEHPWSIPDDIKRMLDLQSGRELGRIYRLAPQGFRYEPPPDLGAASTAELVEALAHRDSWRRETAHRLLYERQDGAAAAPLRELLRSHVWPVARLHALWSLWGLNAATADDVLAALADREPHLRAHAVQIAERMLVQAPQAARELLERAVAARAADDSIRVRFQAAFTLGALGEAGLPALAEIARQDAQDPWVRTAVLSSIAGREAALSAQLWEQPGASRPLMRELAYLIGAGGDPRAVRAFFGELARQLARIEQAEGSEAGDLREPAVHHADVQLALCGLASGLAARGRSLAAAAADAGTHAERLVRRSMARARDVLSDPQRMVEERVAAVELIAHDAGDAVIETLAALLVPQELPGVQFAALRGLASRSEPRISQRLLEAYAALTPSVRGEVLEALAARPERSEALLAALEQGTVAVGDLSPALRARLLNHPGEALRTRAARLFAAQALGPRREVLAAYAKALRSTANAEEGRRVFRRECASCHRLHGEGQQVGPDLAAVRHRTPEELLAHILDPNREVAPEFTAYVVVQLDGRVATGLIAAETGRSITLRRAEGHEQTILRENIESLAAVGSLMPEGLEQRVTPAEMAHLLAYLLGK